MSKVACSTEFGRHHVPPVLILHCTADQLFCLCTNDYAKSEPACCPGAGVDWPEWPHVLGTLSIGMILQSFLPFLAMAIGQFFQVLSLRHIPMSRLGTAIDTACEIWQYRSCANLHAPAPWGCHWGHRSSRPGLQRRLLAPGVPPQCAHWPDWQR